MCKKSTLSLIESMWKLECKLFFTLRVLKTAWNCAQSSARQTTPWNALLPDTAPKSIYLLPSWLSPFRPPQPFIPSRTYKIEPSLYLIQHYSVTTYGEAVGHTPAPNQLRASVSLPLERCVAKTKWVPLPQTEFARLSCKVLLYLLSYLCSCLNTMKNVKVKLPLSTWVI